MLRVSHLQGAADSQRASQSAFPPRQTKQAGRRKSSFSGDQLPPLIFSRICSLLPSAASPRAGNRLGVPALSSFTAPRGRQLLAKGVKLSTFSKFGESSPARSLPPVAAVGSSSSSSSSSGGMAPGGMRLWFEEEIEEDLRWLFGVSHILHTGVSQFQDIQLLETPPFGKVLVLDGKLQSAEADEFVYHECLVHPSLLSHKNPTRVFIMGGGEGSTAREALRHKGVQKVVMCDIDKVVVEFCRKHLSVNSATFSSPRLHLIINDAMEELRGSEGKYDVIVGDLADPVDGGPCYKLYTKSFYQDVVKPKLDEGGILVTQAGPAGILSAKEVYTPIYNTLRQVFKYVVPYAAHVPSYADTWGWIMASDSPISKIPAEVVDERIRERVEGDLRFLDGETMAATMSLNKHIKHLLESEVIVYTEDSPLFIHGHGTQQSHASEKLIS